MKLFISVTVLLTFGVAVEGQGDLGTDAVGKCFVEMLCGLRDPMLVRGVVHKTGPKFTVEVMKWFSEFFPDSKVEDTDEWWDSFPDLFCIRSEEEQESIVSAYMDKAFGFFDEACRNSSSEECRNFEDGLEETNIVMAGLKMRGHCKNVDESVLDVGDIPPVGGMPPVGKFPSMG